MKNKNLLEKVWDVILRISWEVPTQTKITLLEDILPTTGDEIPYPSKEEWEINFIYSKILMYDFMSDMGYNQKDKDKWLDYVNEL